MVNQPALKRSRVHAIYVVGRAAFRYLRNGRVITCPVCGYQGPFNPSGWPLRLDAECRRCATLERHRLLVLADKELKIFSPPASVLHFAPEAAMTAYVRPIVDRYVTADLFATGVDLRLDIEHIDLPDEKFDLVLASHVLEHVDDVAALREIRRVLKPGGTLVAMVPIVDGWETTYENSSVVEPAQRLIHFGQSDHVRWYGRDFRERLETAGYTVSEFVSTPERVHEHATLRGDRVFIASKQ